MTLRRRWAFSIVAILALFALNLSVYLWGNGQRSASLLTLKTELERKDLIVEIGNAIDGRQREVEVIEPLLASGTVELDDPQLAEMRSRVGAIEQRIERLVALPGPRREATLVDRFEQLSTAWATIYEVEAPATGDDPDAVPPSAEASSYQRFHTELTAHLNELETGAAADATAAEARFAEVAELTDRITLAIFVLSSGLAIGIAVWFSRFLRAAFARYVTAEVVSDLLETPKGLAIGGEKRLITVLMADLRGFTTMTDQQPAEKVVAALNTYLGQMTEIILEAGGVIDEFIGDAILVFFGAPAAREDHAEAAVACALRMQLAMREVNEAIRAQGLPELEMGIGLHSGEAVVGNIGSTKRTKYGAVGTTVNLASRIQSHTVGGQVLASAQTLALIEVGVRVNGRHVISLKGLEQAVEVIDVGGIGGERDLHLPRPGESLAPLADSVAVRLSLVAGTLDADSGWPGRLTALSARAATIRTMAPLAPFDNVKLELPAAGSLKASWAYAKVLPGHADDPDTVIVRFTTLPPPAAAFLRASLDSQA